jgi:carboxyl-terminal processing protease
MFIAKITTGTVSALFLLSFLSSLSGCATMPPNNTDANPPSVCPVHLQKLCEAYDTVERQYVKKISNEEMTDMFIRGFMKELREEFNDSYSKYTTLKDRETEIADDEKYTGIGMDMKKDTNPPYAIKVQRVFRGTPAYAAGIKRGDLITHVNGVPVGDKTLLESRALIRGKSETPVSLAVARPCEGNPFIISIRRREIADTVSGIAKMIAPHYAYAYIPSFDSEKNMAIRVRHSLKKIAKEHGKLRGFVIDLRNNPGGSVLHAVYFVSLFVKKGDVLYDKAQDGKKRVWSIPENNRDILSGIPIAVLVNEDSASASEIVAGAMQDFGRAVIVGTKTFGKGVMQTHHPLKDESELYLTSAYTFTPNHTFIGKAGIIPDIFAKEGKNESCTGDRQLAVALDVLKKKNAERTAVAKQ